MVEVTVKTLFDRSRKKSYAFLGTIWAAVIPLFLAEIFIAGLTSLLNVEKPLKNSVSGVIIDVIAYVLVNVLSLGFSYMIVQTALGKPANWTQVFHYFSEPVRFFYLLLAKFVVGLVTMLGYFALIIPGIYLSISYIPVIPMIIAGEEEGQETPGIWEAMESSRKAVQPHWFTMFGFNIVLLLLYIPCILIIPAIWLVPLISVGGVIQWATLLGKYDQYESLQSEPDIQEV